MSKYATVPDLKTYADFEKSTDDDLLDDLLTRAEAIVDTVTHRNFACSGSTYSGSSGSVSFSDGSTCRCFDALTDVDGHDLWLDRDLCGIAGSIVNGDGGSISGSSYVFVDRDPPYFCITLLVSAGVLWTYVTDHEQAIAVPGYWGYSMSAPADIVHSTIRLALWLYRQRESNADSDRPIVTQAGVTIMPMRLPSDIMSLLRPYIRMRNP